MEKESYKDRQENELEVLKVNQNFEIPDLNFVTYFGQFLTLYQ